MMGSNPQQMMQNPHMGPAQGQQGPGNQGIQQHPGQMQQTQQVHNPQGQPPQSQAPQAHQNENVPEDAIRSIKYLAKEDGFKNSLTKLMEVASKAFLSNATADNIQSMETEQKQRVSKKLFLCCSFELSGLWNRPAKRPRRSVRGVLSQYGLDGDEYTFGTAAMSQHAASHSNDRAKPCELPHSPTTAAK